MNWRRIRRSWLLSNRHYLIPLFLLAAAVSAGAAAVFAVAAAAIWVFNKLHARLPIETGPQNPPETFVYREIIGPDLKLDLYRPVNAAPGTATVIFAHGGGWISGSRSQPNNVSWCRFLADRGFAVASIDYRFAYTNTMAEIVDDFSTAVDFVRDHREALRLPRPLILMGLSAGGHLALCHAAFNTGGGARSSEAAGGAAEAASGAAAAAAEAAAASAMRDVRAVVAYYAPSDLTDLFSAEDKSFFARFGAGTAMKTLPRFDEDAYERFSPINSLTEQMVPVLAAHGRADEVVPYNSSVKLIRRLRDLGVHCRFLVHKTGGHTFEVKLRDYRTTLILKETVRFMRQAASG